MNVFLGAKHANFSQLLAAICAPAGAILQGEHFDVEFKVEMSLSVTSESLERLQ